MSATNDPPGVTVELGQARTPETVLVERLRPAIRELVRTGAEGALEQLELADGGVAFLVHEERVLWANRPWYVRHRSPSPWA